jgi:hypothetical protein
MRVQSAERDRAIAHFFDAATRVAELAARLLEDELEKRSRPS